jgi:hypothetical protein
MRNRVNAQSTRMWRGLRAVLLSITAVAAVAVVLGGGGCGRSDAKVQIDLTTPRSAATVFTRALEAGDAETAKSAAYGGGLEIEWVEAMAKAMSGMRELSAATQAKFGAEAESLVSGKQTLKMSNTLADAEIQINGERATIIPTSGDGLKIPMKRIDGNWKIDVGLMTRGEDISYIVKQLRALGEIAPKLSKDVEAGKFTTVTEIRREMSRSVTTTVFNPAAVILPATNPAPEPTTTEENPPL